MKIYQIRFVSKSLSSIRRGEYENLPDKVCFYRKSLSSIRRGEYENFSFYPFYEKKSTKSDDQHSSIIYKYLSPQTNSSTQKIP
jgi:glutamate formiminotransferase